jgi:hypothetical protein
MYVALKSSLSSQPPQRDWPGLTPAEEEQRREFATDAVLLTFRHIASLVRWGSLGDSQSGEFDKQVKVRA